MYITEYIILESALLPLMENKKMKQIKSINTIKPKDTQKLSLASILAEVQDNEDEKSIEELLALAKQQEEDAD